MHVLLYTISYPNKYKPQSHIFFEDQAKALSEKGMSVGVISAISVSLKTIFSQAKFSFGLNEDSKDKINKLIYLFPAVPKNHRINTQIRGKISKKLFHRYVKKYGAPDIVHVHVAYTSNFPLWLKNKLKIPYVVTEHQTSLLRGLNPPWQRHLAKTVYEKSKINLAVSEIFATKLQAEFNVNFLYMPNLVDVEFFSAFEREKQNRETVFLNVGITKYQKNQGNLIRAFVKAFSNNKSIKLVIAGSGEYFNKLKHLITYLKAQDQISLYGQASREEVRDLMQLSDYFVLSSHYETFGVVLIEAMACGLPVLSTRSGGPQSIITDNRLGELCDNTIDDIARGLQSLKERDFDSKYIRKSTVNNYSAKSLATMLLEIYES